MKADYFLELSFKLINLHSLCGDRTKTCVTNNCTDGYHPAA